MARQIKAIIEMTASQTKEFLASLGDSKNEKNRKRAILRAKRMKFNVVL